MPQNSFFLNFIWLVSTRHDPKRSARLAFEVSQATQMISAQKLDPNLKVLFSDQRCPRPGEVLLSSVRLNYQSLCGVSTLKEELQLGSKRWLQQSSNFTDVDLENVLM